VAEPKELQGPKRRFSFSLFRSASKLEVYQVPNQPEMDGRPNNMDNWLAIIMSLASQFTPDTRQMPATLAVMTKTAQMQQYTVKARQFSNRQSDLNRATTFHGRNIDADLGAVNSSTG
jgi:hypothetical protein